MSIDDLPPRRPPSPVRIGIGGGALVGVAIAAILAGCAGASAPVPSDGSRVGGGSPSTARPDPATSEVPSLVPSPTWNASAAVPSPSPVPIPPLTGTFRSPTMGYTVRYPADWTVTAASEAWKRGENDFWDDPNGDRIESPTAGFRGGSQPLAAGQTATTWIDAYLADQPPCGTRERIPLGGSQAVIALNGCWGLGRLGGRVYDVVVGVGGRIYNFTMEGVVDRDFLVAMLATVEFDPASARD